MSQLPTSCAESADFLQKQRAVFEEYGVFTPRLIDGTIEMLRKYNDRTLRRDIGEHSEKIMELVNRYFYCG